MKSNIDVQQSPAPSKKIVDINQPQTCKNQGCGQPFKEKDNHETACSYHPGPAVFHDRMKGVRSAVYNLLNYSVFFCALSLLIIFQFRVALQWKCCDVHVKEFDEFMGIPPCTKGWHSADPVS